MLGRGLGRGRVVDDAIGGGKGRGAVGEERVVGGELEGALGAGRRLVAAGGGDGEEGEALLAAARGGGEEGARGAGGGSELHVCEEGYIMRKESKAGDASFLSVMLGPGASTQWLNWTAGG